MNFSKIHDHSSCLSYNSPDSSCKWTKYRFYGPSWPKRLKILLEIMYKGQNIYNLCHFLRPAQGHAQHNSFCKNKLEQIFYKMRFCYLIFFFLCSKPKSFYEIIPWRKDSLIFRYHLSCKKEKRSRAKITYYFQTRTKKKLVLTLTFCMADFYKWKFSRQVVYLSILYSGSGIYSIMMGVCWLKLTKIHLLKRMWI